MLHLHHYFRATLLYLMEATTHYWKAPCPYLPLTNQLLEMYEKLNGVITGSNVAFPKVLCPCSLGSMLQIENCLRDGHYNFRDGLRQRWFKDNWWVLFLPKWVGNLINCLS